MTNAETQGTRGNARLLWVGVIAAAAGFITTFLRTQSLLLAIGWALAAAVVSILVVALWDPRRKAGRDP